MTDCTHNSNHVWPPRLRKFLPKKEQFPLVFRWFVSAIKVAISQVRNYQQYLPVHICHYFSPFWHCVQFLIFHGNLKTKPNKNADSHAYICQLAVFFFFKFWRWWPRLRIYFGLLKFLKFHFIINIHSCLHSLAFSVSVSF